MPSLAGEHLQELESLVGPERQRQEEIIKGTLGSMYSGEEPYSWFMYTALTRLHFQLVQTPYVFQDIHGCFLPTLTFETVSSMYSLFMALVLFPHVQKRAQAELDLVIGRDRLPTFDDRPRLPYVEALCKELTRWQMVTPLGMTSP